MAGALFGAATLGAGGALLAGSTTTLATSMTVMRFAPAGLAIGKGTERLVNMLQNAGTSMDARIKAVSSWLPAGQRALMTSLEGGARMLSGGAGERARQIILQPNGETIVRAFNVGQKTYEVIAVIKPEQ